VHNHYHQPITQYSRMEEENNIDWNGQSQQSGGSGGAVALAGGIESALTTLQPIRDLAKNWDIDIAAW
jgi:hypothetical protein